jgi:hypothetical protein
MTVQFRVPFTKTERGHKLNVFFQIIPSVDGRDRWAAGTGNTLRWMWKAPRWFSFRSPRA